MSEQNNGNNGVNNGTEQKESWFKKQGDKAYNGWVRFKTSKVGRCLIIGVKGLALAGIIKVSYDEGKKAGSVTNVVNNVEPEKLPETAMPEPAPAEEAKAE